MLDFVTEGHVPVWIWFLYSLCVFPVFIIGFRYIKSSGYYLKGQNHKAFYFLCFFTVFALFYCLNPDFFRYRDFAQGDYKWIFLNSDIKDIEAYFYVALICDGNFELFRILIWGCAFLLFYITSRILKAPAYLSLLFFFLLFNDVACYGRATLAMAVYFLGLSLILEKKWYILGVFIAVSSAFFHHSMVVAIAILPVIFMPKNRFMQFVIYVSFFVIVYIIIGRVMVEADSMQDDETLGYFGRKISSSQNKIENGSYTNYGSVLGILNDLIGFLVFYVPVIGLYSKINSDKKAIAVSKSISQMYKVTLSMVFLSTGFLVFYQSFNVLFYRVLYMCMIPIPILLATLLSQKTIKKDFVYLILVVAFLHHLGVYVSNTMW